MAGIVACTGGTGAAIVLQSYGVANGIAKANFRGAVFVVLIMATNYPHASIFSSVAHVEDVPDNGKT